MDEKLWRENGKKFFFEVCFVRWGEKKKWWDSDIFILKFSLLNERKIKKIK